jgi:hypothetical protein
LAQAEPTAFDELAHRVPGDAEQAYFLDLKPGGEAGRHWERIREQLEANPTGQEALNAALQPFRVEAYGLEEFVPGPAVSGYWNGADYVIIQVSDGAAVVSALRQHFRGMTWKQEEFEGKTLYYGQNTDSWQGRERLAWTLHDNLLFLTSRFSRSSAGQDALSQLQALLNLTEEDSLAALDSWKTLRSRLPEAPMGVVFFNVAEQAGRNPPAPGDTSLSGALAQNTEALALSAEPQEDGMRVEIVGALAGRAGAPPELRALLELPAVDPLAWTSLPAGTAIALISQDASVPFLKDLLSIKSLNQVRDTVGLDLEADLAGEDGPLTGEFALGFTPPLSGQPISQGLPAGQMLFLTQDASPAQMASVQAAM